MVFTKESGGRWSAKLQFSNMENGLEQSKTELEFFPRFQKLNRREETIEDYLNEGLCSEGVP